jgi:hypothetical protein
MNWRVLVIEKHPQFVGKAFAGILWEPLPRMDPLQLAQFSNPSGKRWTFYAHFSVEHESSFSFKLGMSNFDWGFLIYSNFETNIERFVARVDCKDVRYKTY